MSMLIVAAVAFLVLHLGIAGTPLRDKITATIGEVAYFGLFSIASIVGIVWLVSTYNAATAAGSELLWDLGPGVKHLGFLVIGIAFIFGLPGVLMPSPTSVAQGGFAERPDAARGVLRITRHPFLWSVALWAAFHLVANGDQASAIFFGTWLVLSVCGTFSIDAKRARALGTKWLPFARVTSNIPFAAILGGRQKIVLSEVLTWRQGIAVLLFAGAALLHARLFGVSPFPGGWVPPV